MLWLCWVFVAVWAFFPTVASGGHSVVVCGLLTVAAPSLIEVWAERLQQLRLLGSRAQAQ